MNDQIDYKELVKFLDGIDDMSLRELVYVVNAVKARSIGLLGIEVTEEDDPRMLHSLETSMALIDEHTNAVTDVLKDWS